jgi:hypothetical protein
MLEESKGHHTNMKQPLTLELRLDPAAFDPDIRCPDCNGPCVTDTEAWSSHCTSCTWSTDYDEQEDAFLVNAFDCDLGIGLEMFDPDVLEVLDPA